MTLPNQPTASKQIPFDTALQTSGRMRIAFVLCIVVATIALMLFLFVSVFLLPVIVRWDAAHPVALLAAYIFLLGLTALPFWAARYLNRNMQNKTPRSPRAAALFILSGLFLIPALILIPMGANDILMESGQSARVLFGLPGVLCVALSMFLAHLAIQQVRTQKALAKQQSSDLA